MTLSISKPTLLIDQEKCKQNIAYMVNRAKDLGVDFRPHFKTHQSLEIGRWFKEKGVAKITVSSLEMAQYFSEEWEDITVAFPANILEIDTINKLAEKVQLNLLVESIQTLNFLQKHLHHKIKFYIKINIGNERTGILPTNSSLIEEIINASLSTDKLEFIGFLGHAGQTYKCRSQSEIQETHNNAVAVLKGLKNHYQDKFPDLILSYGDTPSCSVARGFDGIDEIRPGNFVFYDTMQVQIGSCSFDQIAVGLACPIVSIHEDRQEMVVYGGGIHLSKDRLIKNGDSNFGNVASMSPNGWNMINDAYVRSLSQEHGVIRMKQEELKRFSVGDLILVLPVHSCMTANLMKHYQNFEGKTMTMMGY